MIVQGKRRRHQTGRRRSLTGQIAVLNRMCRSVMLNQCKWKQSVLRGFVGVMGWLWSPEVFSRVLLGRLRPQTRNRRTLTGQNTVHSRVGNPESMEWKLLVLGANSGPRGWLCSPVSFSRTLLGRLRQQTEIETL